MVVATRLLRHSHCAIVDGCLQQIGYFRCDFKFVTLRCWLLSQGGVAPPMLKSKNATVFNRSEIVRFGDDGYSGTFNQLG